MKNVLAIILGGGRGSRLYPLTSKRSKPAVPFGSEFRLIDIPISNCINADINKIYILTQFLMASLNRHIIQTYKFDNFSDGFADVLSAEQTNEGSDWYQGTADAVRKQLHHVKNAAADTVIILSGDHLYQMDYKKYLKFHIKKDADITLAGYPIKEEEVNRFGIMKVTSDGQIKAFAEKPKDIHKVESFRIKNKKKPFMASMGIYIFKKEVLIRLLEENQETDFGHNIIPNALRNFKLFTYPFKGFWADIGTISSFYEANLLLTEKNSGLDLYATNSRFYSRPRFLPPSKIINAKTEQVILGSGCIVDNATVTHSVVGLRSIVRAGSIIKDSVFMGSDYYDVAEKKNKKKKRIPLGIGENCIIEKSIIDKNARIGNNVQLVNKENVQHLDHDYYHIREGIIVVPKNTIIPNGFVL